jgi:OOP family OmpA-OmpF porin
MRKIRLSTASCAVTAALLVGLSACAKHQESPPVAALPPPPPPPPPPAPPPSPDAVLQGQLENLGARQTDGGWTVTLPSAKYTGGRVSFGSEDQATLGKVVELLKANLQLRVLIEDYGNARGSKAHAHEVSQMHANAVLRDLTRNGVDPAKIQAQGNIGAAQHPRVEIIFSNAAGEFRPAPVENS